MKYKEIQNANDTGSNRTFMELKSTYSHVTFTGLDVLIVPLWN